MIRSRGNDPLGEEKFFLLWLWMFPAFMGLWYFLIIDFPARVAA
jgi:hypothetical protein